MPKYKYRQLEGFDGHVLSSKGLEWLAKQVYNALQHNGILELVFGIKPSGTSHILLTPDDWDNLRRRANPGLKHSRREPDDEADFLALSSISFATPEDLHRKLKSLAPKKMPPKKKKKKNYDTSQANKAFRGVENLERGQFENMRVLYRTLGRPDAPHALGVGDISWRSSIRVFGFAYNLWHLHKHGPSPTVLDLAWCEARTPELKAISSTTHLVPERNQHLTNPGKKNADTSDDRSEIQTCASATISQKLLHAFQGAEPSILLVHDRRVALNVLKSYEVNVSEWKFWLNDLLRGSQVSTVYVVDVQPMVNAMLGPTPDFGSIADTARRLGLLHSTQRCAGEECRTLVEIFREMACRGPIDEQARSWPSPPAMSSGPTQDDSEYEGSGPE
ncbi:hypothetical protein C8R43DRAFT_998259 [Mycena crocata]|nr:hypothetical protein C8R43DRAFT_998259 [Mycena crocata]